MDHENNGGNFLTIDVTKLAEMVAGKTLATARNKRAAVNEVVDHYPELRSTIINLMGENTHNLNKQFKAIETITGFDARNGNVLANYDLQPEEVWRYGKDRINKYLQDGEVKITRCKLTKLALEHKPE